KSIGRRQKAALAPADCLGSDPSSSVSSVSSVSLFCSSPNDEGAVELALEVVQGGADLGQLAAQEGVVARRDLAVAGQGLQLVAHVAVQLVQPLHVGDQVADVAVAGLTGDAVGQALHGVGVAAQALVLRRAADRLIDGGVEVEGAALQLAGGALQL